MTSNGGQQLVARWDYDSIQTNASTAPGIESGVT